MAVITINTTPISEYLLKVFTPDVCYAVLILMFIYLVATLIQLILRKERYKKDSRIRKHYYRLEKLGKSEEAESFRKKHKDSFYY